MQKLVTIYVNDNWAEARGVCEHLARELADGWRVISVTPVGSGVAHAVSASGFSSEGYVAGWLAVVLEKGAK